MGAWIYTGWYREGQAFRIEDGQQVVVPNVDSVYVDDGSVVQCHRGASEGSNSSAKFYSGSYGELYHYWGWHGEQNLVKCEKAPLYLDMVTLFWNKRWSNGGIKLQQSVPVGDHNAGRDFPNDEIEEIFVPANVNCTVWEHGGKQGRNVTLAGNDNTTYNLGSYNLNRQISSIHVAADDMELISGPDFDMSRAVRTDREPKVLTGRGFNNSPTATVTLQIAVSDTWSAAKSEMWDARAGVTVGTSVSGGIGVAEVSANVEISVEAGYGESKESSREVSLAASLDVECPPMTGTEVDFLWEVYSIRVPMKRVWRNKRSGRTYDEVGILEAEYASDVAFNVK